MGAEIARLLVFPGSPLVHDSLHPENIVLWHVGGRATTDYSDFVEIGEATSAEKINKLLMNAVEFACEINGWDTTIHFACLKAGIRSVFEKHQLEGRIETAQDMESLALNLSSVVADLPKATESCASILYSQLGFIHLTRELEQSCGNFNLMSRARAICRRDRVVIGQLSDGSSKSDPKMIYGMNGRVIAVEDLSLRHQRGGSFTDCYLFSPGTSRFVARLLHVPRLWNNGYEDTLYIHPAFDASYKTENSLTVKNGQ